MFHAKDGWYFARTEDGGVRIVSPIEEVQLDEYTWCSAIASVSARGDCSEAFQEAQWLHSIAIVGNGHPKDSLQIGYECPEPECDGDVYFMGKAWKQPVARPYVCVKCKSRYMLLSDLHKRGKR